MAEQKQMQAFMVFFETALMLKMLPDEDAGKVIKAAVRYFLNGEIVELDGLPAEVAEVARLGVDKSRSLYAQKVEAGRASAAVRWGNKK